MIDLILYATTRVRIGDLLVSRGLATKDADGNYNPGPMMDYCWWA